MRNPSCLLMVLLLASYAPASAQEQTADVRTWAGQAWKLTEPSIEVFYTIVSPPDQGGRSTTASATSTGDVGAATGGSTGRFSGLRLFGSMESLGALFESGPQPMQGHRQADTVTLYKSGAARQVPVASLASLVFLRTPVKGSALPPYLATSHYRYAATAILKDGSRIDADYINLGTAVLRGATPQGRVEIPWHEIEVVRFEP
jgi:hypothetical protein